MDDERFLAAWPETLRMNIDGLEQVLFCHATPRNDTEIFTRSTPEERLLPVFAAAHADVVICGHTHMQFDRMVGSTRVVNAGSVGMPFGKPGAYWALLGPNVELRRTDYDLDRAAALVRQTSYPAAQEFSSRNILSPLGEKQMLELFAPAQLR
jgi:predicted phosphodiesterase